MTFYEFASQHPILTVILAMIIASGLVGIAGALGGK
jgi:hypothetical protein